MPPKIYKSEAEKKAAYALNKKLKRIADKLANDEKNSKKSSNQLISEILVQIVNDIPRKSELLKARRSSNTKAQAVKRAAVKEPANTLAKRQKYEK